MKHQTTIAGLLAAATLTTIVTTGAAPALAQEADHGRPGTYTLNGDAEGSRFEGIGADRRSGAFYVSEVTGGEIHRGDVRSSTTEQWIAGDGTDGRYTARGITVDGAGNVFVAGGPNGIGTGRPDLWVYSPEGDLLASLRVPGTADAFLNDVAIGADGAAYFTNSNDPQVFRVAQDADGEWAAELWADATGTVSRSAGFNLGGIVLTADESAFVVAQGNVGKLFRFGFDGTVTEIATPGADLVNADGLVREGNRLTVVRNFSKAITTLRISADGSVAGFVSDVATDPSRVLTTAESLHGRTLYVDSEFGDGQVEAPYEVVTNPFAG
ncbi:SMP-30/gluconolactonase/LRE family protein [Agromyces sp. NPDC127015]|uniref:SMP-30/gluconolactonase/LRE family protein n=1 Tax=Agromyces sp. NPDC127015 TaxID=3347108 RepID=UPI00365AE05A